MDCDGKVCHNLAWEIWNAFVSFEIPPHHRPASGFHKIRPPPCILLFASDPPPSQTRNGNLTHLPLSNRPSRLQCQTGQHFLRLFASGNTRTTMNQSIRRTRAGARTHLLSNQNRSIDQHHTTTNDRPDHRDRAKNPTAAVLAQERPWCARCRANDLTRKKGGGCPHLCPV